MDEQTKRDIQREIEFSIRELSKPNMSDYLYGLLIGQLTVLIWFRDGRGDWTEAGNEARTLAEQARRTSPAGEQGGANDPLRTDRY